MKKIFLICLLFACNLLYAKEYEICLGDGYGDFETDTIINYDVCITEICPIDNEVCKIVYVVKNFYVKEDNYIYITEYIKKGDIILIQEFQKNPWDDTSEITMCLKVKDFTYNKIITDIIE